MPVAERLRGAAQRARDTATAAAAVRRGWKRWASIARAPRAAAGEPRVFYGVERLPAPEETAYGGILKFQRLAAALPNEPRDFNVLYLGSSSRPLDAAALVRVARLRRAAFVWNQNGVAYPGWAGASTERLNRPMRRLLHAADHVFFQSRFCKESADRFLGAREGPSEVLHNAVDTSVFTPGSATSDRPLTLLLGGTQYQEYRLATALRAFALVRETHADARLLVSGALTFAPDAEARAHALVEELGLAGAVEFVGAYSQVDAPALLRRADLLLHTKVNDPCPSVVIEAMACGLPVAYAASGGVPELVGADAGVGVPTPLDWEREVAPDPHALAEAVLRLAEDLPRYGAAARTRAVERFDLAPWIERHRQIFEELVRA